MDEEVKMLKATRNFIKELLSIEVRCRENRMMDCINNGLPSIDERIKNYQEAYIAQQDYLEWLYEQEG